MARADRAVSSRVRMCAGRTDTCCCGQSSPSADSRHVGTADKKVEGTGLGLALSRKFIERMEDGSGFRVRWTSARRSRSRCLCGVANELILIIEDNPTK
jgi:hypothetical protein